MNCGAVIDNNHSGGARKKEATMILKFDEITGEQLLKLQQLIDGRKNIYKEEKRAGVVGVFEYVCDLDLPQNEQRGSQMRFSFPRGENEPVWVFPIQLLKCEGATNITATKTPRTSFNVTIKIEMEKVPRKLINEIWDILEYFPESN